MKFPPSWTEFNLLVVLWSQIQDVGFKGLSVVGWQAALNLQVPPEHSKEVSDCKQLIKTLIMGMMALSPSTMSLHWCLCESNPPLFFLCLCLYIYVSMIVTQAICLPVSRLVMIALSLSCLVLSRNEDSGLEHHTLQCNPATATGPRCCYSWGPQMHEGRGGMPVSHRNCTQQMYLTL
jgi:hypothetical protein